jgi:hypothetical protein
LLGEGLSDLEGPSLACLGARGNDNDDDKEEEADDDDKEEGARRTRTVASKKGTPRAVSTRTAISSTARAVVLAAATGSERISSGIVRIRSKREVTDIKAD